MGLSIGIVGLPNVGKSTLFNALTKKSVLAANYPFATIDPSVGMVTVPDERLWKLSEFSKSAKTVPAGVEFVDIAGLVKGASEGEGLGNKFLQNIRETDAIAEVIRIFHDENIIHVHDKVDPISDIGVINLELVLADYETVSKRRGNLAREVKQNKKEAIAEDLVMEKLEAVLKEGKLAIGASLTDEEALIAKGMHLLTMKPILYVLNKKHGGNNIDESEPEEFKKLLDYIAEIKSSYVVVDANIESELRDLDDGDKKEFRESMGATDDGINNLIKEGYKILNLETYFTTGEDEARAWTIKRGSTAPEAGAAIHGDFKDKFIRAEVVFWDKLLGAGSFAQAREQGLVRTEGKEYIVQDGDVIEFKV